ncbi:MAG: hypothetical protein LBQ20_01755, partial [Rhodanobacter sp.]|nr:hypothetical protein [Rhodanobacter sp.]
IGDAARTSEGAQLPRFVHPTLWQQRFDQAPVLIKPDDIRSGLLRRFFHAILLSVVRWEEDTAKVKFKLALMREGGNDEAGNTCLHGNNGV